MSARTHRRRAREVAMQALFQLDLNPSMDSESIRAFIKSELKFPELESVCESLVVGVRDYREAIDTILAKCAENWSLKRMAPVDRNVLRLAAYEIRFAPEPTPAKVAISEAIEICKRYSTDKSARFVNGILDRVAKDGAEGPTEEVGEKAVEGEGVRGRGGEGGTNDSELDDLEGPESVNGTAGE